jgi:hypothetical protein
MLEFRQSEAMTDGNYGFQKEELFCYKTGFGVLISGFCRVIFGFRTGKVGAKAKQTTNKEAELHVARFGLS